MGGGWHHARYSAAASDEWSKRMPIQMWALFVFSVFLFCGVVLAVWPLPALDARGFAEPGR